MKMNIKKGDNVLVITGKEKGKVGKVMETSPKTGKVTIENTNMVTKHKKPRSQRDKGGIIKKVAPIDASNAMVVCPACGKATRVSHKEIDGKKVRICKKCGASLDKEHVKTVKKEAKKAEKTAKKAENAEKIEKTDAEVKTTKAEATQEKAVKSAPKKSKTTTQAK